MYFLKFGLTSRLLQFNLFSQFFMVFIDNLVDSVDLGLGVFLFLEEIVAFWYYSSCLSGEL